MRRKRRWHAPPQGSSPRTNGAPISTRRRIGSMPAEEGMAETGPPPLVDSHAHIWGPSMPLIRAAWTRPDYAFPVETYLALLDAHGVSYGVIAAASLFGSYNDYTIAALRRFPRLR